MSEVSFSEASNDGEKPVSLDDFPPFDGKLLFSVMALYLNYVDNSSGLHMLLFQSPKIAISKMTSVRRRGTFTSASLQVIMAIILSPAENLCLEWP